MGYFIGYAVCATLLHPVFTLIIAHIRAAQILGRDKVVYHLSTGTCILAFFASVMWPASLLLTACIVLGLFFYVLFEKLSKAYLKIWLDFTEEK